jgi:hypothetical protein
VPPPPGQVDPEVLEHGTGSWRPGRVRAGVLLALALALVLAAVVLDRQVHRTETVAVGRCVQVTVDAVDDAVGRVSVMAGYVRPTLAGGPPRRLRGQLLAMISASAAPGRPTLRRARGRCAATEVWLLHDGLRQTRGDCLRLLDGQLSYLQDVAADGQLGFGFGGVPRGRCRTG